MTVQDIRSRIEALESVSTADIDRDEVIQVFNAFKNLLNNGSIRAAEKNGDSWHVHRWVKAGILLGFRIGEIYTLNVGSGFRFFDKDTYPLKSMHESDGVRIVPGGTGIRDGSYLGKNIIIMPPAYINVGAYIDDSTLIDSHALVGSCAQIGKNVHLSAGAQIGGVLEPVGSMPVIIEDNVLVGGNTGIFEGTIVRDGAVIGAGTVITGSTPVYDLVLERIYRKTMDKPLEIPRYAVVVPGTRPIKKPYGQREGIGLVTPVIVKYRDEKTDAASALEDALR
jgi:2,3,4,5-tetrahydropyridine-2,6-dicarboxylate N-succinyltransferase